MADHNTRISLKLFVDTKAEKVVFAEAGKDFVDFLFYLLSLPVGTVAGLLKEGMPGSLGKVYQTIDNLSESYLQKNQRKSSLINPRAPICATDIPLLLFDYELHNRKSYYCRNCYSYVADFPNLLCPLCKKEMTSALSYAPPSPQNTVVPVEGGFVKGLLTFMVMDDLEFMPISTKTLRPLLRKFNLKEADALEEMDLDLDRDGALKLLKFSLESETVLTSFYREVLKQQQQQLRDGCKPM